ncbi:helix-turn-helix domain-containing protein [Steroidobacter sp.]|uniref:helix-turn-helix domain-containing protein n=1 Tax=Steroidobacter sp. TaxID=1978227 RepID=UPI0039C8F99B
MSQQAVFAYELGDRRVSVLILSKLAKTFGVSVEDLMEMTPPKALSQGRAARGKIAETIQNEAALCDPNYRCVGAAARSKSAAERALPVPLRRVGVQ